MNRMEHEMVDITPEQAREMLKDKQREPLVNATDELAQTIAGMRWEYAAVAEIAPGVWRFLSQGTTTTQLACRAVWFSNPGAAGDFAKRRGYPDKIYPRVVSGPEAIR